MVTTGKAVVYALLTAVAGVILGWFSAVYGTTSDEERIALMLYRYGMSALSIEEAGTSTPHFTAVIRDAPWCIVSGAQSGSSERWMLFGYDGDMSMSQIDREWPPKGTDMTALISEQPTICSR